MRKIRREVTRKMGKISSNQKDRRQGRLYFAPASERQSLFTLLPSISKILLRAVSSAALRTSRCPDDYSGSPFGCFRENAGGTPATTEPLWREGSDDFFETRIAAERIPKSASLSITLALVFKDCP